MSFKWAVEERYGYIPDLVRLPSIVRSAQYVLAEMLCSK